MSQIAQLSEAEIEERFHITGTRPVAFMLAGFAKDNEQFSVMFQAGQEMYLTTLLAVKPEKGLFIFDCSGGAETNRKLLARERNVFVGRPDGIRVQFTTGAVSELVFAGSKAFAVALPKFVVRLQRRDLFFDATLIHVSEHEVRPGIRQWRFGIAFKKLPINDENRIQRYIGRLERERHDMA